MWTRPLVNSVIYICQMVLMPGRPYWSRRKEDVSQRFMVCGEGEVPPLQKEVSWRRKLEETRNPRASAEEQHQPGTQVHLQPGREGPQAQDG